MTLSEINKQILTRGCLVGIYLLFGGAVFQYLETVDQHTEEEHFEEVMENLKMNFTIVYNITMNNAQNLINEVIKALEEHEEKTSSSYDWAFFASVYFSVSVITTIGYGHMAPATFRGRLFCIFYAMVGIPLCMMALKSVGEKLNDVIKYSLRKIYKRTYHREVENLNFKVMVTSVGLMGLTLLIGGFLYLSEGWSYFEGIYYCFIALSTIGFGDMVPNDGKEPESVTEAFINILRGVYIVLGMSLVSTVLSSVADAMEDIKSTMSHFTCCATTPQTEDNSLPEIDDLRGRLGDPFNRIGLPDQLIFPTVVPFRGSMSHVHLTRDQDYGWFY